MGDQNSSQVISSCISQAQRTFTASSMSYTIQESFGTMHFFKRKETLGKVWASLARMERSVQQLGGCHGRSKCYAR